MATSHRYVPADAIVLEDTVFGAGLPWSSRIDRGELLVLVDLEGQQAIDFRIHLHGRRSQQCCSPNPI